MRFASVFSRISFSASIAVHAGMPVACVIRSHSCQSRSKPSQPDEVPFQAITLTLACASNSAARRISESSNCASAGPDSAISVTLKREKWAVTSGSPAIIAVVTRSEEHTSELQSPDHLVCRLLLEKKKKYKLLAQRAHSQPMHLIEKRYNAMT